MLRIGIMLDSYMVSAWIGKIVEDIQHSDIARIALVIRNTPPPPPAQRPGLRKRLQNHWKLTLYHAYEARDYQRNKSGDDAKASQDLSATLSEIPSLTVLPLRKGFTDRFSEPDLAAVQAADLDVIFRFGFRIVRGGVLSAARFGIWSFHHDDNLEYRGGPPLFWEIFEGNPISGTVLQILTDSLDGGHVIYRGHSSSDLTSLYRNRNQIYWKTAEFAMRRLQDLHRNGFEYLQSLPTYNEKNEYNRGIYRTPNTPQMLQFLERTAARSLRKRVNSRLHGGYLQWSLALRRSSPDRTFADTSGYQLLPTPTDRFYADPCLVERHGKTYLFFEDFRYAENRALLSCIEIAPDGTPGQPFEVLRRPYHLSYPFLFEHAGEIYMIPETKQNKTVELYRATHFPHGWEFDTVLLDNVFAVDATILQRDGLLWMFVGISNGKYSNSDELGIFWSSSLRGPWTPHPANPVLSDVRRARPAGALFLHDGKLIRPSQNCGPSYGYGLVFSEVLTLTQTDYAEREVARINPGWTAGNLGTHTYSRTSAFEVIDASFPHKLHRQ